MDYRIVPYLADQIIGHLEEGMPKGGCINIKADYPSTVEKPCNVHIWRPLELPGEGPHNTDYLYFMVSWDAAPEMKLAPLAASIEDAEFNKLLDRKRGHITVRVKDLEGGIAKSYGKGGRSKWHKEKRERSHKRLAFKNMIIVTHTGKDYLYKEICLQIGFPLVRAGILNETARWELYMLFVKYAKRRFPGYWRVIEKEAEEYKIFKYVCDKFVMPYDGNSFRKYLWKILSGRDKTIYRNNESFLVNEEGRDIIDPETPKDELDKTKSKKLFKSEYIRLDKGEDISLDMRLKRDFGSRWYAPIYSKKIQAKKEKGKYIDIPSVNKQIIALKKHRVFYCQIAKALADKKGIKYKSAMRRIQMLRKKRLSQEEIRRKLLGENGQEE